jgi:hypothetical protein
MAAGFDTVKCFVENESQLRRKFLLLTTKKDLTEKWNSVTLRLPQSYACLTAGPSLSVKE